MATAERSDAGATEGAAPLPARRSRTAAVAAVVVAVVTAGLVLLFATSPDQGDRPTGSPLVGRLAPAINASDTAGRTVDLDRYRGSWVLVNFFATWCGPCKLEHPELVEFERRHAAAKDAAVLSVSFNDSPAAVADFFARNGGDWPVIAEGNAQIALDFGVVRLPESYLVAPTGLVVHKFEGGVRADDVDRIIGEVGAAPGQGSGS